VSFVVTIDGPAAAGKSTTARAVAAALGWNYLDTGAYYRALGLKALRARALDSPEALVRLAGSTSIGFSGDPAAPGVSLDGEDVTEAIRSPETGEAASRLAALAPVREILVRWQRALAGRSPLVGEGRDLGTVVFPDADVKLYLDADLDTRARRRLRELAARGVALELAEVAGELEARDHRDRTREASPLRPAPGAVVIDTTGMDLAEQVAAALAAIRAHPRFPAGAGPTSTRGPGGAGRG
jgi:cytidylate kinase